MIVRVFGAGAAKSVKPLTVAETVTSLSDASSLLSLPVTVTVPVLSARPAAMVSSRPVLSSKSPETAGDTAAADTATRTSSLVAWLSSAVTVLTPWFSEISSGERTSVTVGAPSSSVIVRVFEAGAARPVNPLTVAEIVTSLFGASSSLSTPVTVTVSVLSVAPLAMVNSRTALSSKSPSTAGDTAAADTVT